MKTAVVIAPEILGPTERTDDEWESYIRAADPVNAIFERAKRIYEFWTDRQTAQGGSDFSAFMAERFGLSKPKASMWRRIGEEFDNIEQLQSRFAPDWRGIYLFITAPPEVRQKLIASGATIDQKTVSAARRAAKIGADQERILNLVPAEGKYRTLIIDPPWDHGALSLAGRGKPQYAVMSLDELAALDVGERWADDICHLYLWSTNNFLPCAVELMARWGFDYKTVLTWCKPRFGLGSYFRSSTEQCLFGIRGTENTRTTDIPTHFEAPIGRHSEKPEVFYEIARRASYPAIGEVFQVQERAGIVNLFGDGGGCGGIGDVSGQRPGDDPNNPGRRRPEMGERLDFTPEEAVQAKLGEQRRFVIWWDGQEKRKATPGNLGPSPTTDAPKISDFGLDRDTVHRWRKRLADPKKFDAALEAAHERCVRVCEASDLSGAWQAERQRIQDEANAKRSAATKEQPRTEGGKRLTSGSPTTSGDTRDRKAERERESSTAKAQASGTNRGAVERMGQSAGRVGELIRAQKETVGLNTGARGIGTSAVPKENRTPTLADAGIDKKLSSRAQKLRIVDVASEAIGLSLAGKQKSGGCVRVLLHFFGFKE